MGLFFQHIIPIADGVQPPSFQPISPALIGTPLLIFDSSSYRSAIRHPPPNTRLSTTISPDNRPPSCRIAGDEASAEDSETTYLPPGGTYESAVGVACPRCVASLLFCQLMHHQSWFRLFEHISREQ
jgi:hypothetical protein